MNIIGPDALVFGVDDVEACGSYLTALRPRARRRRREGGRFEGLDGTASSSAGATIRACRPPLEIRNACCARSSMASPTRQPSDRWPTNSRATGRCGALADGGVEADRRSWLSACASR